MVQHTDELRESDFDRCFDGEPSDRPPADDLRRGRVRRQRWWSITTAAGVAVTVAAVGIGALPGPHRLDAVPAEQTAAPTSPGPTAPVGSGTPTPSASRTLRPMSVDTAPPLDYDERTGYADSRGRSLADPGRRTSPFQDTTKNTYDLVRDHLDPKGRHLLPYEAEAFSGGGGLRSIEVGQKLGWTIKGQSGEGMVLVAVTRLAPGQTARVRGSDRDGLCSGGFGEATCKKERVAGRTVYVDRQPGGAFVVDYLQPDGELAGAYVDPLFGNNTTVPLRGMDITLSDVVDLLADPDLDVVG